MTGLLQRDSALRPPRLQALLRTSFHSLSPSSRKDLPLCNPPSLPNSASPTAPDRFRIPRRQDPPRHRSNRLRSRLRSHLAPASLHAGAAYPPELRRHPGRNVSRTRRRLLRDGPVSRSKAQWACRSSPRTPLAASPICWPQRRLSLLLPIRRSTAGWVVRIAAARNLSLPQRTGCRYRRHPAHLPLRRRLAAHFTPSQSLGNLVSRHCSFHPRRDRQDHSRSRHLQQPSSAGGDPNQQP